MILKRYCSVYLILSVCALIFLNSCTDRNSNKSINDKIIGIKIYQISKELDTLFDEWSSLGINTIYCNPDLISNEFMTLADKNNIEIFLVLPVFYNPEALAKKPDLYAILNTGENAVEEWVKFVCPSRSDYRAEKLEYIKDIVQELKPDGISIDFIRHFVYWEKIYPDQDPAMIGNTCYCDSCLNEFSSASGINFPDLFNNKAGISDWIKLNCFNEWNEWRSDLISSMVKEIVEVCKNINVGIKINVHAVPWKKEDFNNALFIVAGQDIKDISNYTDYISPMCYSHMLKRKPEWINAVVEDMASYSNCLIVPSIQVNKAYLESPVNGEEFRQTIIECIKYPSAGIIFWSWEQLEKQEYKKVILKETLSDY